MPKVGSHTPSARALAMVDVDPSDVLQMAVKRRQWEELDELIRGVTPAAGEVNLSEMNLAITPGALL